MNKTVGRLLFWTPRILCILFTLFLSLFALGVVILAFAVHRFHKTVT